MALYLTYDNQTLQDGLGAQALRILGIFSISRAFRIKYLHTPILKAVEDISHVKDGNAMTDYLVKEMNGFLDFNGYSTSPKKPTFVNIRDLSFKLLAKYIIFHRFSRKDIVLRVLIPFPVLNRFPSLFNPGIKKVKLLNSSFFRSKSRGCIVLHVRKGYDEKYANLKYARNRHLSYLYYSELLSKLSKRISTTTCNTVVVHTDLVKNTQEWKPLQSSILEGYKENTGIGDVENIELLGIDLSKEISFPKEFRFEIFYCDDFFSTFRDMCNAEVLVIAKSAYSYLAGLLNEGTVIWPVSHNHSKLKRWIDSRTLGVNCA